MSEALKYGVRFEAKAYDDIYLHLEGGRDIDLHNFADYEGRTVQDGNLEMRWTIREPRTRGTKWWKPSWKQIDVVIDVVKVTWIFEGATELREQPRDPEMPLTEDSCLAGYIFQPEHSRFIFVWQSGAKLEFAARNSFALIQDC